MITFGDGAEDAFTRLAASIPEGYTVALLPEGREPDHDHDDPRFDVCFVEADIYGVSYHRLHLDPDRYGHPDRSTTYRRGWEDIARIHVY